MSVENDQIPTIRCLTGTAWIVLIFSPSSPLCRESLHLFVYFYAEQTVHLSPVCKCTIKELVASDHRMWTKAKSGQLFTCLPLILRWPLGPCGNPPPPLPHTPPTTTATLKDNTGRKGKQVICVTDSVLPQLVRAKAATSQRRSNAEIFGSTKSPDGDIYLKHDPLKIGGKLNTTGMLFFFLLSVLHKPQESIFH